MAANPIVGKAAQTPLAEILAGRIRGRGPISFAEYMRECLYHPLHGYYSRAEPRRFADYYTSPDVHPIFGRLLARQFAEMWKRLGQPEPFWVVEAGAGSARLAGHILDFAEAELAGFYRALRYVAVERSAARRAAHSARLARHAVAGRALSVVDLPEEIPVGCIFSNELLDALPVHRVCCARGALRELFVNFDGERFCNFIGPLSTPALAEYFALQGIELPEGHGAEAGLEACEWIERAGGRLGRGYVVTIDYGFPARELYSARHERGTLLAYQNHRASENYFAAPGEQDLTAHLNFTALELWGRRAGLEPLGMVSQSHFLMALGRGNEFADLYDPGQSEVQRIGARLLLKNLIAPQSFGETFHVLVQQKNAPSLPLTGLGPL